MRRCRGEAACGICLGARRAALNEEDLLRGIAQREPRSDDVGAFNQEGSLTLTVLAPLQ